VAYTTEELLDEVALKLQRNPRYDTELRLKALNRGLVDLTRFVSENWKVEEVLNPLDPLNTNRYAMEFPLPVDSLFVQSLSFNGRPLRKMTQNEFVATGAEFDAVAESGTPQSPSFPSLTPMGYYIRSNRYVNLWPRPQNQRIVQIYHLAKPPELVNPDDEDEVPELDSAYSDALIFYACYWCTLGVPGEDTRTATFRTLYKEERARVKFDSSQNSEHKIKRDK